MAKAVMRINPVLFRKVVMTSPRLNLMLRSRAAEIVHVAKGIFMAEQRKDNEFRTSETTPPKYIGSFKLRRVLKARNGYAWHAVNDDPAWSWVEYGAHAGGETFVLKYRPLSRGLDVVAARR